MSAAGRLRLPTIHPSFFIHFFFSTGFDDDNDADDSSDRWKGERGRPLVKAFTMPARGAKTHCGLDYGGGERGVSSVRSRSPQLQVVQWQCTDWTVGKVR